MAISSAQRETHRSVKKAARNKQIVSSLKTFIVKANKAIAGGELEQATERAAVAIKALDKAAQKGIIHPNNAARRKSRLMKKLHQSQASGSSVSKT